MKSELLTRIKDAETDAASRIAKAEAEAKAILADARRQAEAILADAKAQADFAYQGRLDQARNAAESEGKKVVASGTTKAGAARKKFEAGLPAAVQRSVRLVEERLA